MEDYIKRVNLSFDLRREKDKRAYEVIASKQHKSSYIINKIVSPVEEKQGKVDKALIKEAMKEVLEEARFYTEENFNNSGNTVPDEVFNLFDQM